MSLEREWAVALPNGALAMEHQPPIDPVVAMFSGRSVVQSPPRIAVFRTERDAEQFAEALRHKAISLGVDEPLIRVVSRFCGPWSSHLPDDISAEFSAYLKGER